MTVVLLARLAERYALPVIPYQHAVFRAVGEPSDVPGVGARPVAERGRSGDRVRIRRAVVAE